jgi:ABC-type sugar transport system ATPase subunit
LTSNDVASRAPGTSDSVPDPDLPVALSITNLHKSFGGREVVKGLSLSARLGHVTAVLGPNGAGP